MKAFITLVMGFLISVGASANDFAAAIGFRSNSADIAIPNATGVSVKSKTGFGGGVLGFFDMTQSIQMRTGLLYNQRDVKIDDGVTDYDMNAGYVDIPVTANFKFADYAGFFAGPVLALLAQKDNKLGNSKDPEAMSVAFQLGASFKFAPQLGAELFYEVMPSEYWDKTLKNLKTVGANLLITFE
ncbi:MAG: outer membrane beta-barrel protein [Pseudobdellovibrionaceae bacterium]